MPLLGDLLGSISWPVPPVISVSLLPAPEARYWLTELQCEPTWLLPYLVRFACLGADCTWKVPSPTSALSMLVWWSSVFVCVNKELSRLKTFGSLCIYSSSNMQLTLLPGVVMQLKTMTYLAVTYYRICSNLVYKIEIMRLSSHHWKYLGFPEKALIFQQEAWSVICFYRTVVNSWTKTLSGSSRHASTIFCLVCCVSDPVAHQSRCFPYAKNSRTNKLSSIKAQEGDYFF